MSWSASWKKNFFVNWSKLCFSAAWANCSLKDAVFFSSVTSHLNAQDQKGFSIDLLYFKFLWVQFSAKRWIGKSCWQLVYSWYHHQLKKMAKYIIKAKIQWTGMTVQQGKKNLCAKHLLLNSNLVWNVTGWPNNFWITVSNDLNSLKWPLCPQITSTVLNDLKWLEKVLFDLK